MQIQKNKAIFEELMGCCVVTCKRDSGVLVTLLGDEGRKLLQLDRNAKIDPLDFRDSSMEHIDRNRATFEALAGFTIAGAEIIEGQLKVVFVKGEEPRGIAIDRDAKITLKRP